MITAKINNFTIDELKCPCCGLFNYSDDFLVRLRAFRIILDDIINPTSGSRCIKHNEDVGGVPNSLHEAETKPAEAVDVTNNNVKRIYETAVNCRLFNEVILYKRKNIVHLGFDPNQSGNYFKIKE